MPGQQVTVANAVSRRTALSSETRDNSIVVCVQNMEDVQMYFKL
jgi:hypothetical protein